MLLNRNSNIKPQVAPLNSGSPFLQKNSSVEKGFFGKDTLKQTVEAPKPIVQEKNDFDFSSEDEMEKKLMDPEISITKNDSLILMSFRLPVCVTKQSDGSLSLKESRSMLYPTIFRLKEKGLLNF